MDQQAIRQIDRSSPIPLYYQLQEILKEEIDGGRWKPGELLPSEAEMEEMFGVSRSVTRKALDVLEGDGQVYRVKGKGTVVAQPKFRYEGVGAAAEWGMREDAKPALSKMVAMQRVPAGGHVGRLLGLSPGEEVYELTFVESVDEVPASLTQMFLRRDATPPLADDDPPVLSEGESEALAQLRDRYHLVITESQLSIEATRANSFEADLLGIAVDSPVFLLGSLEIGSEQKPVAFRRSVVRSDHFRFTVGVRHGEAATRPPLGGAVSQKRSWS